MSTDFVTKDYISDKQEVFCIDCEETLVKASMHSVYGFGEKDDSTTFRGVCQVCRHKEIVNPKDWKDNKVINQKRWDKKNG